MKKYLFLILIICLLTACFKNVDENLNYQNESEVLLDEIIGEDEYAEKEMTIENVLTLDESKRKVFKDSKILKKEEYPQMDGSTALLPLMAQFRSDILDISLEEAENDTKCSRTAKAWYNLSSGIKDILIVGEMPSGVRKEIFGVMSLNMNDKKNMKQMIYTPIRRESLVFIVNKNNPIESLTKQNLVDIYTGKITNWKELGGNDSEIEAFQRNEDSGSQTIFRKVLMKDIEPTKMEEYYYPGEMDSLIDVLSTYDNSANAIGFSVYYYVTEMYKNDNLKLIKVDNVEPNSENISNKSYPLLNDSYVAIRLNEKENSNARKLYDYIRSEKGKESIIKAGYVPVN